MHGTRPRDDGPIVALIQIGERRNLFPAIGKIRSRKPIEGGARGH
jgi:hypothetical protein